MKLTLKQITTTLQGNLTATSYIPAEQINLLEQSSQYKITGTSIYDNIVITHKITGKVRTYQFGLMEHSYNEIATKDLKRID